MTTARGALPGSGGGTGTGAGCAGCWPRPECRCTGAGRSASTISCCEAVARLEPRWEAELSGVEFAVEEIPRRRAARGGRPTPVPLARLDPGSPGARAARRPGRRGSWCTGGRWLARADGEEELGELVFEVIVEEFARLLGLDPEDDRPRLRRRATDRRSARGTPVMSGLRAPGAAAPW